MTYMVGICCDCEFSVRLRRAGKHYLVEGRRKGDRWVEPYALGANTKEVSLREAQDLLRGHLC